MKTYPKPSRGTEMFMAKHHSFCAEEPRTQKTYESNDLPSFQKHFILSCIDMNFFITAIAEVTSCIAVSYRKS